MQLVTITGETVIDDALGGKQQSSYYKLVNYTVCSYSRIFYGYGGTNSLYVVVFFNLVSDTGVMT